jgi:hypothetical protein
LERPQKLSLSSTQGKGYGKEGLAYILEIGLVLSDSPPSTLRHADFCFPLSSFLRFGLNRIECTSAFLFHNFPSLVPNSLPQLPLSP